jgi:hypothetical protein
MAVRFKGAHFPQHGAPRSDRPQQLPDILKRQGTGMDIADVIVNLLKLMPL